MSALGLVNSSAPVAQAAPASAPASGLQVQFSDTLSAGNRFWVRGRLLGSDDAPNAETTTWWKKWRSRERSPEPLPPIQLETRIGGTLLSAEVPVESDGRFEAKLIASVPPARRGWRVARNRVTVGEQVLEACNVVLLPPPETAAAIIVLLPLDATLDADGPQQLATMDWATRLPNQVQRLQSDAAPYPVYYLACVSPEHEQGEAELALAATALGWPRGHFLQLTAGRDDASAAFAEALERLRWLFAGSLDLLVHNLEPAAAPLPVEPREPAEEWAVVRRLVSPGDATTPGGDGALSGLVWAAGPRPTRGALLPRHPVVFCHGMLAFSMLKMQLPEDLNCFSPLRQFLRERGFRALFPQVPPTSGVAERAESLRDQIRAWTNEPVNIIAHSMGGLDARYLITHLGLADRVKSLTTVSTPHRGTFLADWFRANFRNRVPLLLALEAFGTNVNGFGDCRQAVCAEFNARTPDSPKVRYFSFGGEVSSTRLSPVLRRAWNILTPVEGPNDGMVSVASSRWGEYLGTVHADHFAQTPDAIFLRDGENFDALGFYTRLVEELAHRGF